MSRVFMRRQISSSATLLYKLLFMGVMLVAGLLFIFVLVSPNADTNEKYAFLITCCLVGFGLYFMVIRFVLKAVHIEIDEENLYVVPANYRITNEIVIPLKNIYQARQDFLMRSNPERVVIELLKPEHDKDCLHFIPKHRFFPVLQHPVVEEINTAVVMAKNLSSL